MTSKNFRNKSKKIVSLIILQILTLSLSSCSMLQFAGSKNNSELEKNLQREWKDSNGFLNKRLSIGGTKIHYIDYGGEGQTLVFLSGLGNSAHIFDDFAQRFINNFHVIAVTRRGFGESGRPEEGYDTERLTEDVRELFDSLHLTKVILLGHSIAGDELTEFAVRYPERTSGIIYLDGAYDRSNTTIRLLTLAFTDHAPPTPPAAEDDECSSKEKYREYLKDIYGVYFPMSEVTATRIFDEHGTYLHDASNGAANMKIVSGEKEPEYSKVISPALAIYSVNRNLETDYAWTKKMFFGRGVVETKAMRALFAQQNWESTQREKFADELNGAKIIEIAGASHYIFISHPDFVENEIKKFLMNLNMISVQ